MPVNPLLRGLLGQLRLAKLPEPAEQPGEEEGSSLVRASGSRIYYRSAPGRRRRRGGGGDWTAPQSEEGGTGEGEDMVVDLLANYGSVPFGYHHPDIWAAVQTLHASGEATFLLPEPLPAAEALSSALARAFEDGRRLSSLKSESDGGGQVQEGEPSPVSLPLTVFTNSGAETVEAAIKLARAHTGRLRVLSTDNGFHGKTLGALSATGRAQYQAPFGAPVPGFEFVPFGDAAAARHCFEQASAADHSQEGESQFAAFIVEPIQGEGGISVPPVGYIRQVRDICSEFGVVFILDEVQTGLGRTGDVFAANTHGICPDILVTAKALSGGICPVGAVMYREALYNEYFLANHSSTFAGNSLACRVGLATLELLKAGDYAIVKDVALRGKSLLDKLQAVASGYPHFVRNARGRGFLVGVEFWHQHIPLGDGVGEEEAEERDAEAGSPSMLLQVFYDQGLLAAFASSHLLNVSGVRVAVALNSNNVLRIEPALNISDEDLFTAASSIELCAKEVSKFGSVALVAPECVSVFQKTSPSREIVRGSLPEMEAGILLTALSEPSQWALLDSSLECCSESSDLMTEIHERLGELLEPFIVHFGRKTSVCVIPRTFAELDSMATAQRHEEIQTGVATALAFLDGRGGQYLMADPALTISSSAIFPSLAKSSGGGRAENFAFAMTSSSGDWEKYVYQP